MSVRSALHVVLAMALAIVACGSPPSPQSGGLLAGQGAPSTPSYAPALFVPGAPVQMVPQIGHTDDVVAVAFTPDSRRALTASKDTTLKLWDVETGSILKTLVAESPPRRAVLSPDGKRALTGHGYNTKTGRLCAWDLQKADAAALLFCTPAPGGVGALALSPDGKTAFTSNNLPGAQLVVWDLEKGGQRSVEVHPYGVPAIAVSPDGRHVATGGGGRDGRIKIWDVLTSRLERTLGDDETAIVAVAWSPDGASIAAAQDKTISIWDVTRGVRTQRLAGHSDFITSLTFASTGATLLSGSIDRVAILWDARTGAQVRRLAGSPEWVTAVAIAPNGARALTGAQRGAAFVWDLAQGVATRTLEGFSHDVKSVKVTPDGARALAVTRGGAFEQWDLSTGKLLVKVDDPADDLWSVDVSRDGQRALTAGKKGFSLWDLRKNRRLRAFPESRVKHVAFSPDGRYALSISFGGGSVFKLWDLTTGALARTFHGFPAQGDPQVAVFTNDGRALVTSVGGNDDLMLFDVQTGTQAGKLSGSGGQVESLALSPDGHWLLGGLRADINSRGGVILWDMTTGRVVAEDRREEFATVAVAFSPDGRSAALGSGRRDLRTVEIPSLKSPRALDGHIRAVQGLAYSPDGSRVVSGSLDGTIRVWRLETGSSMVLVSGRGEWIVYDEAAYFDGSRRGGELVAAVQGDRGFHVEQLAPRNNRPDIVLQKIGGAPPELLAHWRARHDRRLAKLGLDEQRLVTVFERAPAARIADFLPQGKWLTLSADVTSPTNEPVGYVVYVNDVPIYGPLGKPMPPGARRFTERIELTRGRNKVEVSARTAAGAESLRDFRYVDYAGPAASDLYFLGFGVTRYRNPKYNLGFAHKDAIDLADTFRLAPGYRRVLSVAFTNENVTVPNLKKAKELLRNATVDDTVVVFIGGHGLYSRDAAAEYYYGTHELDVAHLAETAAPYEVIEDLFRGIGPRRKLLLLDTCESGEPDDAADVAPRGNLVARGFRGLELVVPKAQRYVFDRERYIYNDLTRRTGTIVLSSSSGNERSWESADIQNGVFTKEVVRAMVTNIADTNRDGLVSIDELRSYVVGTVPQRTYDQQHPSVDRDNLETSFELPLVPAAQPILTRPDPTGGR